MAELTGVSPEFVQDLRDRVRDLPADRRAAYIGAAVAEFPDHVLPGIVALLGGPAGPAIPDSPLEQARQLDPLYLPRPHLTFLSERLVHAVTLLTQGKSVRLSVSMPPRSGKSTAISTYLPLWLLRRNPALKIGLISHDPGLSTNWGRTIRNLIENHPELGLEIAPDAGAASEWQTTLRGGVTSRSVGQSIVGRGFNVLILDDLVRDFAAAHSEAHRRAVWEWWTANAYTRLEPPFLVLAVGCLTADAMVLMADGSEKPIADVRPGDYVATYEDGRVTVSIVNNWANQGCDHVYALRMVSGRVIRANARHPFLTIDENGTETWRRTDHLRPGDRILTAASSASSTSATDRQGLAECACATTNGSPGTAGTRPLPSSASGASGEASPAPSRGAPSPSPAKDSADPTTARIAGPQGMAGTPPRRTGARTSATGTASTLRTSTLDSPNRAASAPSADGRLTMRTPAAAASCSSIIATATTRSEVCCATTAISSSDTALPSTDFWRPLSTCALTTDEVEAVILTGYEDVFDIEVDRTHNFIANGLVTHNTRWHSDDVLGRMTNPEYGGDPADWEVINFPAIAEDHDVLGRAPGDPLLSPLIPKETKEGALERWAQTRRAVGTYNWVSQFQGRPAPAEGAVFNMGWWRYWTTNPSLVTEDGTVRLVNPDDLPNPTWIDSWDAAFKGTDQSDYVVGQRWVRSGANRYLVDQVRDRMSFTRTLAAMRQFAHPKVHTHLIEDKANGPAIIDTLRDEIAGLKPVNPTNSKEARARAITPEVESGNVYLPHPTEHPWVADLISELRSFPTGAHDDQVDALSQALWELREPGVGGVTNLARRELPGVPGGRLVDRAAAARTMRRR